MLDNVLILVLEIQFGVAILVGENHRAKRQLEAVLGSDVESRSSRCKRTTKTQ
jgi:hypothetical protein